MTQPRPPQVYGSNQIEIAWTVIPLLIVFVLIMVTARVVSAAPECRVPIGFHPCDCHRASMVVGVTLSRSGLLNRE